MDAAAGGVRAARATAGDALVEHRGASGSSATPSTLGPASTRWASPSRRRSSAKAVMHAGHVLQRVPPRDLHDQGHVEGGGGPVSARSAVPVDLHRTSRRAAGRVAGSGRVHPAVEQAHVGERVEDLRSADLLVLRGEGVDRGRDHEHPSRGPSRVAGTAAREHERAARRRGSGAGTPTPAGSARSGRRSRRGSATRRRCPPGAAAGPCRPSAGRGGAPRRPGAQAPEQLDRVGLERRLVVLVLAVAQRAAVAGRAVEVVVERLVMAKKSASPSMTTQRVSMPNPPTLARRVWSSSATPPPAAVEFTLSTAR